MRRFKKRTIALVLASVITVVGAFGADNYRNSLMGLSFEGSTGENVNLVLQTKTSYSGTLIPMRKDSNTYVLTLPEMNSLASTPNLTEVSSNISSVNIRTMPYSNTAKGYTRITIKTINPSMKLSATNKIFVPSSNYQQQQIEKNRNLENARAEQQRQENIERQRELARQKAAKQVTQKKRNTQIKTTETVRKKSTKSALIETPAVDKPVKKQRPANSNNTYLWLWALLIVLGTAFFYTKAKNQMQEIAGEKFDIDVSDEKEKKNKKNPKLNNIKKTINHLDSTYSNASLVSGRNEYTSTAPTMPVKTAKPAEELEIVDLDELFQEHKSKKTTEEEENDALEDFLSGFSFDDTQEIEEIEEPEKLYNEEVYEKTISNENLKFSKDDISCINQLLDSEINDETLRNIEKYAVSNPIPKPVPKETILEDFVTTYTVSQNIIFTKEDIDTLYKLINIELDNDFITDLRTNPTKTAEMEKDILEYGDKPKKPSEIITLSVKDMLPDLSDALKKQGNKKIESERKAETIYYSEGYEVSTLSLKDDLPDLSIEIKNKNAYVSKPSAEYEYVDTSYTVGSGELKISTDLPDLQDVLANPEKYAKPEPEEVIVDEEALLRNISNVQFKPFDDGSRDFEILNDIPSVSDIQQEFSQFEGFEITPEEQIEKPIIEDEYDDFKSLYSNEYVDFDKQKAEFEIEQIENEEEPKNTEVPKKAEEPEKQKSEQVEDLMKKIEATKIEREKRKARILQKEAPKVIENIENTATPETTKCILDGRTYTIISSAQIDNSKGFYLAKSETGYTILGYIGDRLMKIRYYEALKSEKIHARLSEKLPSGTLRYLVRIGLQKLIVNVKENDIEYVMDLC